MRTANRFFLLTALLLLPTAFADETTKIYPAGGAEDLLNVTQTPEYIGGPAAGSGALILNQQCSDVNGKIFKKDDPGYEGCLKNRMDDQKRKGGKGRSGGLSPGAASAIRTGAQLLPGAAQPIQVSPPAGHPPHVPTGL